MYSTALRDGKDVGALYASEQPPHWNCYVTVESADAAAARAAELGATIAAEPFDVMDVGRMAVIVDPVGAALCLWEPKSHIGATLVNAPGAMTWNDLLTPDPAESARFYGDLFGWTTEEIPDAGGYRVITNGEREQRRDDGARPAHGLGRRRTGCRTSATRTSSGCWTRSPASAGRSAAARCRMWQGTIAVLADPQGAAFAVWTGDYDD